MIKEALLAGALLSTGPDLTSGTVTSASLFKNGFAVVVREYPLKASGDIFAADPPQGVLGTVWITSEDGVKLKQVVATNLDSVSERDASSLDEVLALNVGKRLTVGVSGKGSHSGIVRSASGSVLILERETGQDGKPDLWAIHKGSVSEVSSPTGGLVWKVKQTSSQRILRISAETAKPASVYIVSLERGLSWTPAYSVDISDAKKLKLTAKGTIINDLASLEGIEVRLVTGFPNIPYINVYDPLTSGEALNQFADKMIQMAAPEEVRRAGVAYQMAAKRADFDDAFPVTGLGGFQAEDLFFYRQPNVRLKRGERGYYVLLSMTSEYEHVYQWSVPDRIQDTVYVERQEQAEDVWHSLKFKNTSKQPLTTGTAVTFKSGEILGQDTLRYASAGQEMSVRITKAMDVRADDVEEEIQRKRDALQLRSGTYDWVRLKGTISVMNRKAEAIKLQITKFLTGELKTADGSPKVTSVAKGLRAINPRQKLDWTVSLKPSEKRELAYEYEVYVSR